MSILSADLGKLCVFLFTNFMYSLQSYIFPTASTIIIVYYNILMYFPSDKHVILCQDDPYNLNLFFIMFSFSSKMPADMKQQLMISTSLQLTRTQFGLSCLPCIEKTFGCLP